MQWLCLATVLQRGATGSPKACTEAMKHVLLHAGMESGMNTWEDVIFIPPFGMHGLHGQTGK